MFGLLAFGRLGVAAGRARTEAVSLLAEGGAALLLEAGAPIILESIG